MKDYVLITDLHLTAQSNVRTGDYVEDLIFKFEDVVEKVNSWDATLLLAGDIFDKPTVADFVKAAFTRALKKLKNQAYAIYGNHDTLFDNTDKNYKTSLNLLVEAGTLIELKREDFGNHVLKAITAGQPIEDEGKSQICLAHGFLNKEDGRNTFLFDQIRTDDNCVICLGHDHVQYEDVVYKNSVIYRIGAFVRGIRNDSEQRIPQMLRIRVKDDGSFATKLYPIRCRDPKLIFKEKSVKAQGGNAASYDDIINMIKTSVAEEQTLVQALRVVTTPRTVDYIDNILQDIKTKKESK